ncbi:MAG: redox-regulated ATPase YchF, partial [Pedobacter sp.]
KRTFDILTVVKAHLESGKSIRTAALPQEDFDFIEDLGLLTQKPVMYVCNVDEASVVTGNKYVDLVKANVADENAEVLVISAKIESEIAELESYEERQEFLADLGLDESGVNKLIRAAYKLLNLYTYFTAGVQEVRAWTITKGFTAPQAAGVIHTDFEKGFIRAEVIKYNDFVTLGSENACKDAGKLGVEGKTYVVEDGDIMHFRFNV